MSHEYVSNRPVCQLFSGKLKLEDVKEAERELKRLRRKDKSL